MLLMFFSLKNMSWWFIEKSLVDQMAELWA